MTPVWLCGVNHEEDQLSGHEGREPPRDVWYSLEDALDLLAALEDARDALIDSGHLAVVVA